MHADIEADAGMRQKRRLRKRSICNRQITSEWSSSRGGGKRGSKLARRGTLSVQGRTRRRSIRKLRQRMVCWRRSG